MVIMGVVLINGMIGFITERQSEKAIASLAKTGVREVTVLRDGVASTVSVEAIVRHPVRSLVLIEEEHLRRTFGESYAEFCRSVPRYLRLRYG